MGSGTSAKSGIYARFQNYDRGIYLPRHVEAALNDGYSISHRGLLCWAPLPSAGLVPSARVRFVAVEAVFTFIFFAGVETKLDAIWTVFLPWKRESVDWLPLCSHTALMERPQGDPGMTEEQLEAYNAERKRRVKEQMAVVNKRYEEKERANDLEAYSARKRREKLAWTHKNKAKVSSIGAGVRARAIASRAHECKTCGITLQSVTALAKHLATKAHQEQERLAAGGKPKAVSAATLRSRRFAARKKASKAFYCATCDKAFNIKGHLTNHNTTKKHLEKVAASA